MIALFIIALILLGATISFGLAWYDERSNNKYLKSRIDRLEAVANSVEDGNINRLENLIKGLAAWMGLQPCNWYHMRDGSDEFPQMLWEKAKRVRVKR